MKKYRLALIILGLAIVGGVGLILTRPAEHSVLADLRRYAIKERTLYYDPSETLRSLPASVVSKLKPRSVRPSVTQLIWVDGITIGDIKATMRKDLAASEKWKFVMDNERYVDACKGLTTSSASLSDPDESVFAMSRQLFVRSGTKAKKGYVVGYSRKLQPWEVVWLRIKFLGRNPYTSQKDIVEVYSG